MPGQSAPGDQVNLCQQVMALLPGGALGGTTVRSVPTTLNGLTLDMWSQLYLCACLGRGRRGGEYRAYRLPSPMLYLCPSSNVDMQQPDVADYCCCSDGITHVPHLLSYPLVPGLVTQDALPVCLEHKVCLQVEPARH